MLSLIGTGGAALIAAFGGGYLSVDGLIRKALRAGPDRPTPVSRRRSLRTVVAGLDPAIQPYSCVRFMVGGKSGRTASLDRRVKPGNDAEGETGGPQDLNVDPA